MITGIPRDMALEIAFASTPGCGLLEAMPVAPAAIAELKRLLLGGDVRLVERRADGDAQFLGSPRRAALPGKWPGRRRRGKPGSD
jgi:hypothetical protein